MFFSNHPSEKICTVVKFDSICPGTPPKFNIAPEKWWLEDDPFLLGPGNFSGAVPVKLREGKVGVKILRNSSCAFKNLTHDHRLTVIQKKSDNILFGISR